MLTSPNDLSLTLEEDSCSPTNVQISQSLF